MARVGIGLDAQFVDRYPGGMVGLCDDLRPRLSHLSIVSLRSVDEARTFRARCAGDLPIIHHLSGVEPAGPNGPNLARYAHLDAISGALDARWSCEDIALWSLGGNALPYFTPPLLTEEAAAHAARGVQQLQRAGRVPFLAEIPSFTLVAGGLKLGEYFAYLGAAGDCEIVADVAHVFSYALLTGEAPEAVLHSLPLDRVREMHVAGGRIDPRCSRRYMDTHSDPIMEPVLALVSEAARRCPRLDAVTYEIGVGLDRDLISADLQRVEDRLADAAWAPRITNPS